MLTVVLLTASGIALLLVCDPIVGLWDRHVDRSDRRLDRVYRRAGVRWVPPVHRSRRARRALRHLPITSPEDQR